MSAIGGKADVAWGYSIICHYANPEIPALSNLIAGSGASLCAEYFQIYADRLTRRVSGNYKVVELQYVRLRLAAVIDACLVIFQKTLPMLQNAIVLAREHDSLRHSLAYLAERLPGQTSHLLHKHPGAREGLINGEHCACWIIDPFHEHELMDQKLFGPFLEIRDIGSSLGTNRTTLRKIDVYG